MTNDTANRGRRRVGVYDRPRSADINWVRWIVMIIALLLSALVLYRMLT